ncbi:agamous-like MADS-box protein AGL80 [Papaver somniferum]|uniref:agamous-like MADS-box protein AGL80 n=1 Tax=Papaver somniferum TaxID=3469 RepID=UPI000E70320D|nr:agamous-like MADS-box protein AGL80 [Papaver somniferum]
MARKKVKLAYITNDSARRATFKKRRKGLMKKVSELSTLCGVSAGAIVYGPYDRTPEVWPQQPEAHRVMMRFKSLPEMDQSKKQLNQESFRYNQIGKVIEQFKKQQRENRYMKIKEMYNHAVAGKCSISHVHPSDLGDLTWVLEDKKKAVQRKLSELKKSPKSVLQTTPANTSSAIFTTPTTSHANTTATPNPSTSTIHTNISVGGSNGSGINGGTMAGGTGMYGGVVNNGTGGQERMTPDHPRQAMEALQNQPWFMDVMSPPSIPQPDDQMVNYVYFLGGDQNNKNNNQMMVGGVSPPTITPSYNGGTLGDIFNNNKAWMVPANKSYVPMNNIDTSANKI